MDTMKPAIDATGSQMPSISVTGDSAGQIELIPANPPLLEKAADEADASAADEPQVDEPDTVTDDDSAVDDSEADSSAADESDIEDEDTNG